MYFQSTLHCAKISLIFLPLSMPLCAFSTKRHGTVKNLACYSILQAHIKFHLHLKVLQMVWLLDSTLVMLPREMDGMLNLTVSRIIVEEFSIVDHLR